MESIQGKRALFIDAAELYARVTNYPQVLIDLGTGDGRFVEQIARTRPTCFTIGLDACRENLQQASRRAPHNALYLIANALALPSELRDLATEVTINFPWGSLLEGLLKGEVTLLEGLAAVARPATHLTVRLNGGALAEAGWSLSEGAAQVQRVLNANGFTLDRSIELDAAALRQLPTTWAKRLAFGRDPRALLLSGKRWGAANRPLPHSCFECLILTCKKCVLNALPLIKNLPPGWLLIHGSRRNCPRNRKLHHCSLIEFALHPDLATVALHHLLTNDETQSRPRLIFRAQCAAVLIEPEELGFGGLIHTHAGISHRDRDEAGMSIHAADAGRQGYLSAPRRKL